MSGRDRVFVEANELFPFSVMDLALALAEDFLIDFIWTDELLDEWERVIVRDGQRTLETARSVYGNRVSVAVYLGATRCESDWDGGRRARLQAVPARM